MTTLREAAQMALDALKTLQTDIEWQYQSPTRKMLRKIESELEAALAQPEQEPVAWVCESLFAGEKHDVDFDQDDIDALPVGAMLYTAPPQREWMEKERAVGYREGHQAALKQREWQGLTDEEVIKLGGLDKDSDYFGLWYDFARAIERILREKNS